MPVEQACARQIILNHRLLLVHFMNVHKITASKIHPFFTGGGIKTATLGGTHGKAAAVAGDNLGGVGHGSAEKENVIVPALSLLLYKTWQCKRNACLKKHNLLFFMIF